jgi:DNA polymerase (family 10)
MAEAAREAGLQYIAITDHSQSLAMANGLDERRALAHAARIRAIDAEGLGIRLLAGIECDIKPDGSLDLADDCLAALDLVIVSVHSAFGQERQQMTDRLLRALEHPHVDILGHPTGSPQAAALSGRHRRRRRRRGAPRRRRRDQLPGRAPRRQRRPCEARARPRRGWSSERRPFRHAFGRLRWGVMVARRAWLQPADVLNTRPFDQFVAALRRNRRQA